MEKILHYELVPYSLQDFLLQLLELRELFSRLSYASLNRLAKKGSLGLFDEFSRHLLNQLVYVFQHFPLELEKEITEGRLRGLMEETIQVVDPEFSDVQEKGGGTLRVVTQQLLSKFID